MSVGSNAVLNRLERLLLNDPSTQSPKIHTLRKAFPDTPDTQLRGILKRQDVQELFKSFESNDKHVVLAIGDLHSPFMLERYLGFCQGVHKSEGCTMEVQIGDMLTMHRASYHEDELDALSAKDEYLAAVEKLKPWGDAFPNAYAVTGNHDDIIARKMKTSGLPIQILKPFNEIIGIPKWQIYKEVQIDGVLYRHNIGGSPNTAALNALRCGQSLVGGHYHTRAGVVYEGKDNLFGCLTGCGVDRSAYDQRYNQSVVPYKIGCAVIYEGSTARWFEMGNQPESKVFIVS